MQQRVIGLGFGTYLIVGSVLTLLGPLVPEISKYYGIGYSSIGIAMVLNSLSYLPAVLFGGLLCGRFGTQRVTLVGLLTMGVGYLTIASANSWWLFLIGYCVGGGLGFGLVEAGLNAMVMEYAGERQGRALNMLHVYAAIGAVIGPIMARGLVAYTGEWQVAYMALGAACTVATLVFCFWRFPQPVQHEVVTTLGIREMLRTLFIPTIGMLALAMTFYIGAEIGLSSWMYSYIVTEVGGSAVLGATLNSLFWLGLGLGRFLSANLSEKIGYQRFLFWGGLAAAIALAPALVWKHPIVVTISFFATGLLFAGTFPTILAVGSKAVPGQNGPVAGALIFFAGVGTMVFPAAMGYMADAAGISYAMALALVCTLALTASTGVMMWMKPTDATANATVHS